MLGRASGQGLIFPKLRFLSEVQIGKHETEACVYSLDWAKKKEIIRERHERWWERHWADSHGKEPPPCLLGLPEPWETWAEALQFALSSEYGREVRRCSQAARFEWSAERHFDTVIREACLKPATAFVETAFMLVADCVYDPETSYFSRDSRRGVVRAALLLKFWIGETGRGLYLRNAGIWRLEENLAKESLGHRSDEERAETSAFVSAVREHLASYEEARRKHGGGGYGIKGDADESERG